MTWAGIVLKEYAHDARCIEESVHNQRLLNADITRGCDDGLGCISSIMQDGYNVIIVELRKCNFLPFVYHMPHRQCRQSVSLSTCAFAVYPILFLFIECNISKSRILTPPLPPPPHPPPLPLLTTGTSNLD